MKKKIVTFLVLLSVVVISIGSISVYAYDKVKNTISNTFSETVSDSTGKLSTLSSSATITATDSNYYTKFKSVEATSIYIYGNYDTEIDSNNNTGTSKSINTSFSTNGANAIVAKGQIYHTNIAQAGVYKSYLILCRKNNKVDIIPDYYY